MKYPELKCEEKQNSTVCSLDIKKMREMRKQKYTYNEIADKFKVCQRTAWIHSAPTKLIKNSKKKRSQATRQEHKEKYANDPEYRKKLQQSVQTLFKKRYHGDSQFKEYVLKQQREFTRAKIRDHPDWSRKCALGGHETTTRIAKCQNRFGTCKCPCHK